MTTMTIENSLAKRLKSATSDAHDGVDRSILSAASLATRDRYAGFLAVQYLFHRDVDVLYGEARLRALLPDLAGRRRLPLVAADLADLGLSRPVADAAPAFDANAAMDVATALGWLYVAEGATMGAALLRREAAKIGLSDDFGARHLAPAPEGPAPHWRAFVAGLDAVRLTAEDEGRAVAGARDAFARVQAHVDARLR